MWVRAAVGWGGWEGPTESVPAQPVTRQPRTRRIAWPVEPERARPCNLQAPPGAEAAGGAGPHGWTPGSVPETDAQVARRRHRVARERHHLHAPDRGLERLVAHVWRLERHHHARVPGFEGAHGRGAEAQRHQAVEARGRAAAQQVAEHHDARLAADQALERVAHLLADAAQPL